MTLREIIERCSMLTVDEVRCEGDKYRELVFCGEDIDEWHRIFADVLGPAVKPAGKKPTKDHWRLTKDYGGVWAGQTLFKKEFEDGTVIAMFWPWQDGIHVTLKMALLEKQKSGVKLSVPIARVPFAGLRAWLEKSLF
ncbi:MAG: hypothetical protein JSV60_02160 [Desulfobacterales bacterium]|nr:MAG: hypothetical protein JSV60_02160 [Desulfobacterales bacterium]